MRNFFQRLARKYLSKDDKGQNQMTLTLERLAKTDVAQIVTPNHSLPIFHSQTIVGDVIKKNHSFVVISDKQTDDLLGFVTLAEMAKNPHSTTLDKIISKPILVPESQSLMELFTHMYDSHKQVAFVVDEMGQIIGALKMEQIIAFAVEATATTHSNSSIKENEDGSLAVGAATPLVEIAKQYGTIATKEEQKQCDTIGGLVALTAGHLPSRGEVIKHNSGIEFKVEEIIGRRITKVRIVFPPK